VRIVALSDSHGSFRSAEKVILRNAGADIFVHLGDGEREVDALRLKYPRLDIRAVSGNCDFLGDACLIHIIDTEFARVFCAHGHRYRVKSGIETLRSVALQNDCNVVLYGHTHQRFSDYSDGLHFLNPGSCYEPRDGKPPSYGYVDLTAAGIVVNHVDVG
jgi:putative phosphoesterase